MQRSAFARRGLLALAVLALVWAGFVALTGGFRTEIAGVRISSSNARNPVLLAIVSTGGVLLLSGSARRRNLIDDLLWWRSKLTTAYRAVAPVFISRWLHPTTIAAAGGASLLLYQWARARPLWLDEEMIALNIRDRSLLELAEPLWLDQAAPFGWLATQRIAGLVLGFSETGLRFVPVVFGVVAITAAAWVGRRWMTVTGAVALVLLFSLGQYVFHYSLELKHYSGDIFFGLMLPALVMWALDADGAQDRLRRAGFWWIVAVLGQWWAFGALFVTPACAVILWLALWRVDGWRSAAWFSVFGLGWLLSFALLYVHALRPTLESDFLRDYWSVGMPAPSATAWDALTWFIGQGRTLADQPGGTNLALLFWMTALCGLLFARQRAFLYVLGAIPVGACILAAMRLVPLHERLSLWATPAIYVGIALCVDAGARWGREGYRQPHAARLFAAAIMLVAGLWVCLDIARRGWRDIQIARPADSNHHFDDRTGVEWLLAQRQPGDVVFTTQLALPAIWWYGRVPLSLPNAGRSLPDGSPILELSIEPAGSTCNDAAVWQAFASHRRVLVYLGWHIEQVSGGFERLVLRELRRVGDLTDLRRFAGDTGAAVLKVDSSGASFRAHDADSYHVTHPEGCLSVRPAARW